MVNIVGINLDLLKQYLKDFRHLMGCLNTHCENFLDLDQLDLSWTTFDLDGSGTLDLSLGVSSEALINLKKWLLIRRSFGTNGPYYSLHSKAGKGHQYRNNCCKHNCMEDAIWTQLRSILIMVCRSTNNSKILTDVFSDTTCFINALHFKRSNKYTPTITAKPRPAMDFSNTAVNWADLDASDDSPALLEHSAAPREENAPLEENAPREENGEKNFFSSDKATANTCSCSTTGPTDQHSSSAIIEKLLSQIASLTATVEKLQAQVLSLTRSTVQTALLGTPPADLPIGSIDQASPASKPSYAAVAKSRSVLFAEENAKLLKKQKTAKRLKPPSPQEVKSEQLQLIYVSGLARRPISALKDDLRHKLGIYLGHVHNVSFVGVETEFIVSKIYSAVFKKIIAKCPGLTVNDDFDPVAFKGPGSNPDLIQMARDRFSDRLSQIISANPRPGVKKFFTDMMAHMKLTPGTACTPPASSTPEPGSDLASYSPTICSSSSLDDVSLPITIPASFVTDSVDEELGSNPGIVDHDRGSTPGSSPQKKKLRTEFDYEDIMDLVVTVD